MKKLFAFLAVALIASPAMAAEILGQPHNWGWYFQASGSEIHDRMEHFHNYVFIIICVVTAIVLGIMAYICVRFRAAKNKKASRTTHNTLLEIIWTVIPVFVVIAIMIPSIKLLYYVDKVEKADFTLKVVGYQWFWGYEYPEYSIAPFESRMLPKDKVADKATYLLEVDEPVVLPVGKTVRVLLTGDPTGVIHAWGVQAFGFKRDTIPGRISEGWVKIDKPGTYYGQCYELCGPDHSQMPIKVVAVSEEEFEKWVVSKGGKLPTAEGANPAIPGGSEQETKPAAASAAQEAEQKVNQEQ